MRIATTSKDSANQEQSNQEGKKKLKGVVLGIISGNMMRRLAGEKDFANVLFPANEKSFEDFEFDIFLAAERTNGRPLTAVF